MVDVLNQSPITRGILRVPDNGAGGSGKNRGEGPSSYFQRVSLSTAIPERANIHVQSRRVFMLGREDPKTTLKNTTDDFETIGIVDSPAHPTNTLSRRQLRIQFTSDSRELSFRNLGSNDALVFNRGYEANVQKSQDEELFRLPGTQSQDPNPNIAPMNMTGNYANRVIMVPVNKDEVMVLEVWSEGGVKEGKNEDRDVGFKSYIEPREKRYDRQYQKALTAERASKLTSLRR